jgi:hypothetical protein
MNVSHKVAIHLAEPRIYFSWKVSCISATYLHDVRNDSFERAFDTEPVDALETDDVSEG